MRKHVVIIDYNNEQLTEYQNQLEATFEESISAETISASEIKTGENKKLERSDLLIFPSYDLLNVLRKYLPTHTETYVFERTITKRAYDRIEKYKGIRNIHLVDETEAMASELCNIINRIGDNRFDLTPCSSVNASLLGEGIVINPGFDIENQKIKIINIESPLLSVMSIIEIGVILNERTFLTDKNIKNAYKESILYNKGFHYLLNETNKFASRSASFIDYIEDGYIILNSENKVEDYNKKAASILRPLIQNIKEFDVKSLFSSETQDKAFNHKMKIMNELITIDGKIVVLQIYPTLRSEKYYGTLVIMREFNEIEERQHEIRKKIVGKGHRAKYYFNDIIGESISIKSCIETARKMALSSSSILIEGETGTGKELFAQAIHNYSYRKDYQFVVVNCGALPSSILESELFGYEEGAFTGAKRGGKCGLFELAHKGTIFLDEIGEMPIELQTKLLRVLQEQEVMRLGSDRIISIDIRVIAATNKNLFELVKLKKFREDLFYRLKVLPLKIPPLRNRKNDILLLFKYFISQFNGKVVLSESAKEKLINYEWKGNIRELGNIAEFCVNIGKIVIESDDLPMETYEKSQSASADTHRTDLYDDDMSRLNGQAGMEKDKYYCILDILYHSYMNKSRIGRRKICSESSAYGIAISEQQARRILNDLDLLGLVRINIGRRGSEISPRGIRLINGTKGMKRDIMG